jgi:hypothetical protein
VKAIWHARKQMSHRRIHALQKPRPTRGFPSA